MIGQVESEHAHGAIFGWSPTWIATGLLIATYVAIISEKVNRAIVALLGAGLMVVSGVLTQDAAVRGIDFNTLALLVGMMVVVAITGRTGVFQFVAIWTAKRVDARPARVLIVLALMTALFSALLDNVTTVLLLAPVTLLITEQLGVRAFPFLVVQILASNIGGTATLVGDPPNILIGSAVGFSFNDFVTNVGPIAAVILVAVLVGAWLVWGRSMQTTEELRQRVLAFDEREAIKDVPLLRKALAVLAVVLTGFVFGHPLGLEPGTTALTGAALLLLLDNLGRDSEDQNHRVHDAFTEVEWVTVFFFVGLFVVVAGVEHTGLLDDLAQQILVWTDGDLEATALVVLWVSAVTSSVLDNIPFVATMIPTIEAMESRFGGDAALEPIWWALSLGACLGGNGSLVGASANLTVAAFAERANQPIGFVRFAKVAFPIMLATVALAHVYLVVRYL